MFFDKIRRKKKVNQICMQRVIDNASELQIFDLNSTKILGPDYDCRQYVAAVGLFTKEPDIGYEDMPPRDVSDLIWYCRDDGNIWAEWQIHMPMEGVKFPKLADDEEPTVITVNMGENTQIINKMTHELWTLHKIGSTTLL